MARTLQRLSRVRDLNDEINKLLREKYHWERQIKALGGADYIASAPRSYDADGRELPGQRGYRYFGAAKDLPGVKELFDSGVQDEAVQRTRAAIIIHLRATAAGSLAPSQ